MDLFHRECEARYRQDRERSFIGRTACTTSGGYENMERFTGCWLGECLLVWGHRINLYSTQERPMRYGWLWFYTLSIIVNGS